MTITLATLRSDPVGLQIEKAIWHLLESSPELAARVRVANRHKQYGADPDPGLRRKNDADVPTLAVFPAGSSFLVPGSSAAISMTLSFDVVVETLEKRTGTRGRTSLHDLRFEVVRALRGFVLWRQPAARVLAVGEVLPGCPWARKLSVVEGRETRDQSDEYGSDDRGWNLVVRLAVEVWFSKWEVF